MLPGLPDYTKTMAAVLGILLGYDHLRAGSSIVPFDLAGSTCRCSCFACALMFPPFPTIWGLTTECPRSFTQCVNWLLPYWIGRLYLTDVESFRELGLGMIIGGRLPDPLLSDRDENEPNIAADVYGIGAWEGMRHGGYPPSGFLLDPGSSSGSG